MTVAQILAEAISISPIHPPEERAAWIIDYLEAHNWRLVPIRVVYTSMAGDQAEGVVIPGSYVVHPDGTPHDYKLAVENARPR